MCVLKALCIYLYIYIYIAHNVYDNEAGTVIIITGTRRLILIRTLNG